MNSNSNAQETPVGMKLPDEIIPELARQVKDARLLLNFMLAERPLSASEAAPDVSVPDDVMAAINEAESAIAGKEPTVDIRTKFENAYQRLVRLAKPITADSLKATSEEYAEPRRILGWK